VQIEFDKNLLFVGKLNEGCSADVCRRT